MSIAINVHANSQGIAILKEFPDNHSSITLIDVEDGREINFYLPLEQWWALRKVFPRAEGYAFTDFDYSYTSDHAKADELAARHYEAHKTPPTPELEAELPPTGNGDRAGVYLEELGQQELQQPAEDEI